MPTWFEGFEGFALGDHPYQLPAVGAAGIVTDTRAHSGTQSLTQDSLFNTINSYNLFNGPLTATGWAYLTPDIGQAGNTPDLVLVSKDYIAVLAYFDSPFFVDAFRLVISDDPLIGFVPPLAVSALPVTVADWYEFSIVLDGNTPPTATCEVRDGVGTVLVTLTFMPTLQAGVGALFGLTLADNEWQLLTDLSVDSWWDDLTVVTGARSKPVLMWPRDDGRGLSSAPRIVPASKADRVAGGYQ